jgi:hypothetical protein
MSDGGGRESCVVSGLVWMGKVNSWSPNRMVCRPIPDSFFLLRRWPGALHGWQGVLSRGAERHGADILRADMHSILRAE